MTNKPTYEELEQRVKELERDALKYAQTEETFQKTHDKLESEIEKRTAELIETNTKLKNEINERISKEKLLNESERLSRMLMDSLPHPAMLIDKRRTVIAKNRIADELGVYIGGKCWETFGQSLYISDADKKLIDNGKEPITPMCHFCLADKAISDKCMLNDPNVETSGVFDTYWVPVENDIFLHYAIDVTEAKRAEQQIKASLKEKETLLQEIHHRVKNNMAVVSSLLKLQSNSIEDEQIKEVLKESQSRINAMSAVHETLHGSKNLSEIDLKTYLSKITTSIFQTYSVTNRVKLTTDINGIPIRIDQANPIGLVINELISNSLKYAFPDESKGEITVSMKKLDKELELIVMDDGVGISDGFDWKNSSSLGLKIVRTLVENQLDGSIDMESKNGTKFTIKFNIET
jgi:two-component sensor histidine kinase